MFGWVRHSDEWGEPLRRFRYWYEELPKKNGKTPFVALIGLYLLFADSFGRQINLHTVATTRKQAERLLIHAVAQIKNRSDLAAAAVAKKLDNFLSIEYGTNLWNVLPADAESADGINGHVLADELHRWKGWEFFNTLRWAIAAQPEGLFVGITTAGNDMAGVCYSLNQKTRAIDAGRQVDEAFYGRIYAADPKDDPHDEKTWLKANPSLGTTRKHPLKMSVFRSDYEAAKQDPTAWDTWLRLRLGIWQSGTDSWLSDLGGLAIWDAGAIARTAAKKKRIDCYESYTEADLHGQHCFMAFDGATHHDTTAAVFVFPDEEVDELVRVLAYFWLPRKEAEKQQARVPYQFWSEQGYITLTEGDAVDFKQVYDDLVRLMGLFTVERFYFDPMFNAEWLTQRLADTTGVEREPFPQTIMAYSPPTLAAERLIIQRNLRHNGNPLLTWQLSHLYTKTDNNNNKRPLKRQRGDYKTVDGPCAMIMALLDAIACEPFDDDEGDIEWVD